MKITIWVGAHFFGAGEIADVILLTIGWLALGGVVLEAGNHLYNFATLTKDGKSSDELDKAGGHLASAIALLGVQTVLTLLLKNKPKGTFKNSHKGNLAPYGQMRKLPPAGGPFYKPKIKFTKSRLANDGGTRPNGDTEIGRDHFGAAATAAKEVAVTAYHEAVHRLLTPKFAIFRDFRVYLKQSGYRRSYILRYLEEALAETYGQLRVYGLGKDQLLKGIKFPLGTKYQITIAQLGEEARGVLLGPITVAGMIYNVFEGERTEEYEQAQ